MKPLWIVPALIAGALIYIAVDDGSGIPTWSRQRADLVTANARIASLEAQIERLEREVESLRDDPYAIERAIREDLAYARPAEIVVRIPSESSTPRFP